MNARPAGLRIFWICAIAVTAALVWISVRVLRLENREAVSQATAERQQAVRLALWRMDSALTPVIAREASRPYFHYQSFYPTDRAFTRMLDAVSPGDVLVPSPLLDAPVGVIRLYFQVDPTGSVSSPQVPKSDQRKLADGGITMSSNIVAAEDQLRTLSTLLHGKKMNHGPPAPAIALNPDATESAQTQVQVPMQMQSDFGPELDSEFTQRRQRLAQASTSQRNVENFEASRSQQTSTGQNIISRSEGQTTAGIPATSASRPESGAIPAAPPAGKENSVASKPSEPAFDAASGSTGTTQANSPSNEVASRPELAKSTSTKADEKENAESAQREKTELADVLAGMRGDMPGRTPARDAGGSILELPEHSSGDASSSLAVATSDIVPEWIGGTDSPQLVFWRTVTVNGEKFEQGFWLDWQLTRSWLLSGIGDLVPWADLKPVLAPLRDQPPEALGRTLASIPAELVLTSDIAVPSVGWTPLRLGLLFAWLAIGASLVVTWRVLRELYELAERRGRFAAAVTHELRTPLTTFVLYSQMLAEDMVPDERKGEYLRTMKNESQRLAGIVESVLDYARLGRSEPGRGIIHAPLGEMLGPVIESLTSRAAGAGFALDVDLGEAATSIVRAEPTGVERIFTNLVDNACKYAQGSEPARIDIRATQRRKTVEISVRDFGPGLNVDEMKRVFEPYFRGQRTTDLGVPGVGLGLALARGVARAMHGELRHEAVHPGTMFVLTLPCEG
jgi:signal transduction histidine kinase